MSLSETVYSFHLSSDNEMLLVAPDNKTSKHTNSLSCIIITRSLVCIYSDNTKRLRICIFFRPHIPQVVL